jgi:hypothetical protein
VHAEGEQQFDAARPAAVGLDHGPEEAVYRFRRCLLIDACPHQVAWQLEVAGVVWRREAPLAGRVGLKHIAQQLLCDREQAATAVVEPERLKQERTVFANGVRRRQRRICHGRQVRVVGSQFTQEFTDRTEHEESFAYTRIDVPGLRLIPYRRKHPMLEAIQAEGQLVRRQSCRHRLSIRPSDAPPGRCPPRQSPARAATARRAAIEETGCEQQRRKVHPADCPRHRL